jgi:hypothetical protein
VVAAEGSCWLELAGSGAAVAVRRVSIVAFLICGIDKAVAANVVCVRGRSKQEADRRHREDQSKREVDAIGL